MGRAENWVKNNWRKVLKREGLSLDNENIKENVAILIEKLKKEILQKCAKKTLSKVDIPEIAEEFQVSNSDTSKSESFDTQNLSNNREEIFINEPPIEKDEEQKEIWDPAGPSEIEFGSGHILSNIMDFEESGHGNSSGVPLNTESEDFDFAENTNERRVESQLMEIDVPDIQKYAIPGSIKNSPFSTERREFI